MKMLLRLSREALKYKALYVIAILSTLLLTLVNLGAPKVMAEMTGIVSSGVTDVAAGYDFIAYMMSDGSIKVTGGNTNGQAGNGTTSDYVNGATVMFQ